MALTEFFDSEADRFARAYDHDPKFRARAALWSELIARHAGSARSCLDLGCGPGIQARVAAARGLATVAVDLSAAMIARIPETPNLETHIGDFMSADLSPADLVLCSSVLEYAPDLERAIARLATLVADGGTLLASLPNPRSLYRRAERMAFRATGRPAYRRFVGTQVPLTEAHDRFAAHGLACCELVYYARFAPLLPDLLASNLAVFVLSKVSNKSTTDRATSASS
jgi:SAM-dependent methyltransferase